MSERFRARPELVCRPGERWRNRGALGQSESEGPRGSGEENTHCCGMKRLRQSQRPLPVQIRNQSGGSKGSSSVGRGPAAFSAWTSDLHWASQGLREELTSIPRGMPATKGPCAAQRDAIGRRVCGVGQQCSSREQDGTRGCLEAGTLSSRHWQVPGWNEGLPPSLHLDISNPLQ